MEPQPAVAPQPADYPQPAFYFTVEFVEADNTLSKTPETCFQEVSGIAMEIGTETIEEGGLNSFVHTVPKSAKHGNLVLKRGIIARKSELTDWCKATLQGDFSTLITPKFILVQLKNSQGDVSSMWRFNDAYPVKWSVDNLNSTKNDIAVESIEFAYSFSTRVE